MMPTIQILLAAIGTKALLLSNFIKSVRKACQKEPLRTKGQVEMMQDSSICWVRVRHLQRDLNLTSEVNQRMRVERWLVSKDLIQLIKEILCRFKIRINWPILLPQVLIWGSRNPTFSLPIKLLACQLMKSLQQHSKTRRISHLQIIKPGTASPICPLHKALNSSFRINHSSVRSNRI